MFHLGSDHPHKFEYSSFDINLKHVFMLGCSELAEQQRTHELVEPGRYRFPVQRVLAHKVQNSRVEIVLSLCGFLA